VVSPHLRCRRSDCSPTIFSPTAPATAGLVATARDGRVRCREEVVEVVVPSSRTARSKLALRRVATWCHERARPAWTAVRLVLLVVEVVVAPLKKDEALAVTARALIVAGDTIVDPGRHGRS
jgi:hypothetical protein